MHRIMRVYLNYLYIIEHGLKGYKLVFIFFLISGFPYIKQKKKRKKERKSVFHWPRNIFADVSLNSTTAALTTNFTTLILE